MLINEPDLLGHSVKICGKGGKQRRCPLSSSTFDAGKKIALTAAGGDWYITPQILLGEKKLHFSGCDDRGGTAAPAY